MKPQSMDINDIENGSVRIHATFDPRDTEGAFRMVNRMLAYVFEIDSRSDEDIPALLAEKAAPADLLEARNEVGAALMAPFIVNALDFETMLDPIIVEATTLIPGAQYDLTIEVMRKPMYELSSYDPVRITLPKARFDEEGAGAIDDISSVAELEPAVPQMMAEGAVQPQTEEMLLARVAEALSERVDVTISDEVYEQTINDMLAQMDQSALSEGVTFEDYIGSLGYTMDTLSDHIMDRARSQIAQGFALDAYFRHFDLSIDDSDIDNALARMVGADRLEDIDSLRNQFELAGKAYELRELARRLKANLVALENAEIVYA